ncbi:MAG: DUF885 domain-containing protein [Leptospiraceae bacterium]|nr:DUF885 domain-containing protein [Leptospiraceae bacterium]
MIKTIKQLILLAIASLIFLVLLWFVKLIWFKPFQISHFFERVFWEEALDDPEFLSSVRILEKYGIDFHNDDLTDISPEKALRDLEADKKNLEILKSYSADSLSTTEKFSREILIWKLSNSIQGEKYMYHNYPVNQMFGLQNEMPSFMASVHQVHNSKEAKDYITRLSKFKKKFKQLQEHLKIREQKKIIPPLFIIKKVIKGIESFTNQDPKQNILYTSFVEKLDKVDQIGENEKNSLKKEVENEIQNSVYPSYESILSYFQKLGEKANNYAGVWKLPDGDNFYKYILKVRTTTDLSPEEVHSLGLKEVDRIQKEMKNILRNLKKMQSQKGISITNQMIQNPILFLNKLRKNKKFLFPGNDSGKESCLNEYKNILQEMENGLPKMFSKIPKAKVEIQRVPIYKEKTMPQGYYESPAMDGSRPGIFYANLRSMEEVPKFGMRTLLYHETVPGHHLQIGLQQELKNVPTFRNFQNFTAYAEGWALYAERLAWEQGFQQDPYSNLGRLQAELFRSVRLVVDTGLHYKRWTREEAIEYMIKNTGYQEDTIISEVERYIVMPGQACAYKVGMLKILELRGKAQANLKNRFDLKKFHDVILGKGAMPLSILEKMYEE